MNRLIHHSARFLNALGVVSTLAFVAAGLLGPDVHGLLHHRHVAQEVASDCKLDGGQVHFEGDQRLHQHADCTLASRVSLIAFRTSPRTVPAPYSQDQRVQGERQETAPSDAAHLQRGPPVRA